MSSAAEQAWLAEVAVNPEVRSFYEHIGVAFGQHTGGDEAAVTCFTNPLAHKNADRIRSCSINMLSGVWKCHGCGDQGNAYMAAVALGRSEGDARKLAKSYGLFAETERSSSTGKKPRLPTEPQLKKWRRRMFESPAVIARLGDLKAWSPWAIRRLGLGWDGERVVFPIRNSKLKIQGVARYLPGGAPKMLALPGTRRGLFPAPEVCDRRRPLFVVEGEPDAVSMWSAGVRAVAVPGAQSWRADWARRLWGRELIVICDCDGPGRQLADTIGELPNARVVDLEPGRSDGWDVGELVREASAEGGVWQASFMFGQLEGRC